MLQRLLPVLSQQFELNLSQVATQTFRGYVAAAGSLALVKDLREKSGAPISDVKSALVEADWDPGYTLTAKQTMHQGQHPHCQGS